MTDHLFGITDPGLVRDNNEDVFIAAELMQQKYLIAGVIDGVGGYAGGEIASALTKDCLLRELTGEITEPQLALLQALFLANEKILFEKKTDQELADMACVASIAIIDCAQNILHYVHVGDTRLYLYRDQSLIKISQDQSFVGFLEDSGRLTEAAAMQHPKRNQINQALGLVPVADMPDNYIETGTSPFLPGDLLLVCSDGLTDMISQQEISTVLEQDIPIEEKAVSLIYLANAAGGKDNITVVLAKNTRIPVKPVAEDVTVNRIRAADEQISEKTGQEELPFVFETENQFRTEITPQEDLSEVEEPVITLPLQSNRHQHAKPEIPEEEIGSHQRNHNLIMLGCFLLTLLLGAAVWWFFRSRAESDNREKFVKSVPALLPAEKKISALLAGFKGDTLKLNTKDYNGIIRLTRTMQISRDSLVIVADGPLSLVKDSLFQGEAAIKFTGNQRSVHLNGLKISGFETGIIAAENGLVLKNVIFENCGVALENRFAFKNNESVSGSISKNSFRIDTSGKK